MSFKIGTTTIKKAYLGEIEIRKAYLGQTLIYFVFDTDALAYITAVENADTQALETGVKLAINNFVVGCKADGIWDAIKASCIMAGARTLQGALVPLKGTAPTNFNFVAGDYIRQTGLKGNGSTKYLNTNRNNNVDPQDNKHLSVFKSVAPTSTTTAYIASLVTTPLPTASSRVSDNSNQLLLNINGAALGTVYTSTQLGFLGVSRPNSTSLDQRANNTTTTVSNTSTQFSNDTHVFARSVNASVTQHTDARLAFYSMGESLNLALLDARVTTLINNSAFAINTGLNPLDYDADTIAYINAGYAAGGTLA